MNIISAAAARSIAGKDSDSDECTAKKDIEDNCKKCKKGLASEEACQEDSENEIQDGSTRHSLNGFLPCRNANIAMSED